VTGKEVHSVPAGTIRAISPLASSVR